jgi:hypothetical protein
MMRPILLLALAAGTVSMTLMPANAFASLCCRCGTYPSPLCTCDSYRGYWSCSFCSMNPRPEPNCWITGPLLLAASATGCGIDAKQPQVAWEDAPRTLGVDVAVRPDGATVNKVLFASPASDAGLRAGDPILRINGVETKDLSFSEVMRLLGSGDRDEVSLMVLARGEIRHLVLRPESLVALSERIERSRAASVGERPSK